MGTFKQSLVTPCRLVYVNPIGLVEILPELDLSRRDELWGIESGKAIVALKNAGFDNWIHAVKNVQKLSPQWRISLPDVETLAECYRRRFSFQQTVKILQNHGVDADDWLKGWYWSNENYGKDRVHTFDMKYGEYGVRDCLDSNGFIRLTLSKSVDIP